MQKDLVPGRFVIVSFEKHINKLGLILQTIIKRNNIEYKYVLCFQIM